MMDDWDSRSCLSASPYGERPKTYWSYAPAEHPNFEMSSSNAYPASYLQSSDPQLSSHNLRQQPLRPVEFGRAQMCGKNPTVGLLDSTVAAASFGEEIKPLDKTEFSESQKDYFYGIFREKNENGSGYLNFLEFRACLVEFGMVHLTNLVVKQILDNVNGNGTKMVDFGEFLNMWERAAEKDPTLPFADDLYNALKRMDMLPTQPAPVPFERARNFFEAKTRQMTWEAVQERQQLLNRRARSDAAARYN